MKPLPSVERVRSLLAAEDSGTLRWRTSIGKKMKAGDVAGTTNRAGYIQVAIDRRIVSAHRLVWLLAHGDWPEGHVDHINGNRADNRLQNLRLATTAQNNHNAARRCDNQTGFKGVSWDADRGKFKASISEAGRTRNIGRFPTAEEAHAAYCAAAFSMRGDYARTN